MSDLLLRYLMAQGVNTIFGLPSEKNTGVLMSMKYTHVDIIP